MAPIEKNVRVFDEQGNEYEATYPKRAKGLVKNGRARFVEENTICLACPPEKIMEEKSMENTGKNIADKIAGGKPTMDYVLAQLEMLSGNDAFLDKALEKLGNVKSGGPEDTGAQAQAMALKDAIMAHETTKQKLIALYGKMYDDIVCPKVELINRAFEQNMTYINNSDISKDDKYAALGYVTDKIAELVGQRLLADV